MDNKMNPVVHFEMPAVDTKRMSEFYKSAFGWKTKQLGPEMGDYVVVNTTETDENNMVKTPGVINGGFYQKDDKTNQYPSIVIAVEDINEAMEKVKQAGGKVIGGYEGNGTPDEIPGVGLFAAIIDTEGNRVGVLQPKME